MYFRNYLPKKNKNQNQGEDSMIGSIVQIMKIFHFNFGHYEEVS